MTADPGPGTTTTGRRIAPRRRTAAVGAAVLLCATAAAGTALGAAPAGASASTQVMPRALSGAVTDQPTPTREADHTGISGVLVYDVSSQSQHEHVAGPVSYAVLPPLGGPHNGTWMNAGVYTRAVPSARAVHNLEHGAVWITYRPDLPAEQVATLRAFVGRQSLIDESSATGIAGQQSRFVDMSPWHSNHLAAPIVISSWGYQLRVTSPTDTRLQKFVTTFRHSRTYSPEYGEPVDGKPVDVGGRAAYYGATKPNPSS